MGSLTVHVENEDGHPVRGKRVWCNFVGALGLDSNLEDYTDDDGVVEFDDVPTGTAQVYVDGDLQVEVGIGQNDHEDVTVSL
jgi:hypothetical protein